MVDNTVLGNVHVCVLAIAAVIVLSSMRSPGRGYRRRSCQTDVDALIRTSASPSLKVEAVPLPAKRVAPTLSLAGHRARSRRRHAAAAAPRAALVFLALLGLPARSMAAPGSGATNLLANADFEMPAGLKGTKPAAWDLFGWDGNAKANLVDGPAKVGHQALMLYAAGKPKSFGGAVQVLDVVPGQKYSMSAYVHTCDTNPLDGTAYGQLVVEWQQADGTEINRVWGRSWGRNLSRVRWEKVEIPDVVAPDYAARAVFGIHIYDGPGKSRGAVVVDDVSVTTPGGSRPDVALGTDVHSKTRHKESK